MSAGLKVIVPGAHTTVQDFGRFGFQDLGVPVSGALDAQSLRLANALVENAPGEAGLEILYFGPTLEVTAQSVCIALGGAGAKIELLGDEARSLPAWQSVILQQGQIFRISLPTQALCCYLAIGGGLDLPACLGSLSTYTRSGFGGYKGRALLPDDVLEIIRKNASGFDGLSFSSSPKFLTAAPPAIVPIRVTWGAQKSYFTEPSLSRFLAEPYIIQPDSDRMGFRLSGAKLKFNDSSDIVSDGIATGTIQVPGNGQPIILLADHQTTGGYAKIATVISADLPVIGRMRPGQKVCFSIIEIEEAERLIRTQEKALRTLEGNKQVVSELTKVNEEALWQQNLISGVTNATD